MTDSKQSYVNPFSLKPGDVVTVETEGRITYELTLVEHDQLVDDFLYTVTATSTANEPLATVDFCGLTWHVAPNGKTVWFNDFVPGMYGTESEEGFGISVFAPGCSLLICSDSTFRPDKATISAPATCIRLNGAVACGDTVEVAKQKRKEAGWRMAVGVCATMVAAMTVPYAIEQPLGFTLTAIIGLTGALMIAAGRKVRQRLAWSRS